MLGYIFKRLLLAVPTLFAVLTIVFVLARVLPGDPAQTILGDQASQEALQSMRQRLGVDKSIGAQYVDFLLNAVELRWLPVISAGRLDDPIERLRSLALPAINLGIIMAAYVTRVTRSSMLEVLGEDYIRTARAKGVPTRAVIWRHAFRNGLIPV